MKKNISISTYLLLFIFFLSAVPVFGQSDMLLYNFRTIPQSVRTNPGIIPRSSYAIGLPFISSVYNKYFNSAFTTNELLRSRSKDDSLSVDIPGILPKLKDRNQFSEYSSIDLFFAGIRIKRGYLTFGLRNKAYMNISYPHDLAEFIWYGNGDYINQELDFQDFNINLKHYLDYHIGYALQFSDRFSMGARVHILHGLSNIHFKRMNTQVVTRFDEENFYSFEANTNMLVNTSGIEDFEVEAGSNFSIREYIQNKNNSGFGLDFGFNWQASPGLNLSFSIIDLGYLYWVSGVKNYQSARQNIRFNSIEVDLTEDVNALDVYIDSLKQVFDFVETHKDYFTSLPTRINIAAFYEANYMTHIGFVAQSRIIDDYMQHAFSLSFDRLLTKSFSIKAAWSVVNNTYDNIGLGLVLQMGPVQTYFLTENIISLFDPLNGRNHSIRFGIGINVFKEKDREEMDDLKRDFPRYGRNYQEDKYLQEQIQNYWERKRVSDSRKQ
ncbi:MAG: DUF5723 family protein [Bacteroidales bacterium]|nr:DUF5723 family protein [Bacteroidales bacterium]MCF8388940.1 DUF5723 family protein [Bacteroidales bacterium]MCF8399626.1 DUF5723 family protein [Bacteroidales bacterium]